jgi:ABC-2 type transport system ATP-binding protein
MIEAIQLSKSYGDHLALNNLDMKIEKGEIFALLGQNGAGKTTTINCFLGFVTPTSGDALIDGISVKSNPQESKKALAYIPETVMLYPNLSGVENLAFFSSLAGLTYEEGQMKDFLSKAGLQLTAHKQRVGGYSKGMRQKVGIAIALAKKAKALFLDEPTSGLDPKASNEFSEILMELSKEGTAILMATHDIFRAKEVAHRVGIMKEGQLVSQLASSDLSASELEKLYLKTI